MVRPTCADIPVVLDDVQLWTTVLQFLAAGLVGGFCVLHWVWWRGSLRSEGSAWSLTLSLAMAALLLVGGVHGAVGDGPLLPWAAFLHAQLVGAVVVLCLPATRHLGGGGPPLRPWVAAAVVVLVTRAALWARDAPGPPWPVLTGTSASDLLVFVLLAIVLTYVTVALGRVRLRTSGWAFVAAGTTSLSMLTCGVVLPTGHPARTLTDLWPIPFAVGLETLAFLRLRRAQLTARRREQMRDALAAVTNTAWFTRDADALLLHARDAAREVLTDPSVEASLRPMQRGRFVAELFVDAPDTLAPHERAFLVDVALVVSTAAERYALADRLSQAAVTDALTGLPNRRSLDQHLLEVLERAAVERTRVAVVYCDIDGFKDVNDREGHHAGDDLLRRTGQLLRTWTDEDSYVARLAGDEFALVLARVTSEEAVTDLARRVRSDFEQHVGSTAGPRLTCGIATWDPSDVVDPPALLRHADVAMLEAKRNGTGLRLFDPALRARAEDSRRLRDALERAVAEDRITAYFQPIVDTGTLEVVGLEALARWHEGDTFVLPQHWMETAEHTGLIVPIGRSMPARRDAPSTVTTCPSRSTSRRASCTSRACSSTSRRPGAAAPGST